MRVAVLLLAVAYVAAQEDNNCNVPLDIVFVVDSSGSIQEQDSNGWDRVKMFIIQVTRNFRISSSPRSTHVGLTVYSEFATRQMDDPRIGDDAVGFFDLNTFRDSASLEDAIQKLYYFNSLTNTQDGLNVAHDVIFTRRGGDRPNIPNLAIVITDGVSNVRPDDVKPQADLLKQKATVVAVGVSGAKDEELKQIASNDNLVLRVTDFRALEQEINRIVRSACGAVTPVDATGRCCDFDGEYEGKFCDFEHDGITRFSLRRGETPSEGTGPAQAQSGQFYAYMEASNLDAGDNAELIWKNIGLNGTCLNFFYNMYGNHLGQLFVEIKEPEGGDEWTQIFNVTDETEKSWQEAVIELNVLVSDLRFRAVRGAGYQGDIALDSIRLTEGSCFEPEPEPADNDTANGTCPTPEPPKPARPTPPVIFYPFFQNPGANMPAPAPKPEEKEEEEEEEEVDISSTEACQAKEKFQVVLVGGENATYGRVEIYYNKTFGTVCNSTFTELEAKAICKAAGFYGGKVLTDLEEIRTLDPRDEKAIHLDNLRCKADAELSNCCRSRWGKTSCDHSLDAYVSCDAKPAFCNEPSEGESDDVDRSVCLSSPPAFSVVLRGGEKPNEGRVEIYFDGQFGTVCNDTFGVKEAMAVCRSLGYYAGNVWRNPPESLRLGQGVDRPVLMSGVRCDRESALKDCCYNQLGFDDGCTHEKDVFVRCYTRPEFCKTKKTGCDAPIPKRERPKELTEEEKKAAAEKIKAALDAVAQAAANKPQIFPIPVNPFFSLPFGQQMPQFLGGGMNMMMPNNMNGQNAGGD